MSYEVASFMEVKWAVITWKNLPLFSTLIHAFSKFPKSVHFHGLSLNLKLPFALHFGILWQVLLIIMKVASLTIGYNAI